MLLVPSFSPFCLNNPGYLTLDIDQTMYNIQTTHLDLQKATEDGELTWIKNEIDFLGPANEFRLSNLYYEMERDHKFAHT